MCRVAISEIKRKKFIVSACLPLMVSNLRIKEEKKKRKFTQKHFQTTFKGKFLIDFSKTKIKKGKTVHAIDYKNLY